LTIYCMSPSTVSPNPVLFPTFLTTFERDGHGFVSDISDCNVVLLDMHTRISDYKQNDIDWIEKHKPFIASFCEYDRGGLSFELWPNPLTHQQAKIFKLINDGQIKAIHFCRLLDKTKTYPPNLYPYEKPFLYEEPLLSPDDLFDREYDVIFIANHSASREAIANALFNYGKLKCKISLGEPKISFEDFVKEHKRGKLFISSGAGGYTDERKQFLFSIAGIIQEQTDQLVLHELCGYENCIKINNPPTKDDLDFIYETVNSKDWLYQTYKLGYDFMKTYYSKEYIANDILNKIKKHLW
jgi:hypothetical protein